MTERVLIIDDDVDTLKLVGLMLERQGYDISAAASGAQGLAKAGAEDPDVILLDIMMPDMDGYEVARRLRQDPRTQSTPILMFTAKTELDDKVTGFEVGADDYLTKPTNPTELQAHVRALLAMRHQSQAAKAETAMAAQRGRLVAVLAARGGLGVSTLASNLAAAFCTRGHKDVVLAELTPGHGTLGMELGMAAARGLNQLLSLSPAEITPEKVSASLVPHSSGMKVLLASEEPRDVALISQMANLEKLVPALSLQASVVVLDLGSGLPPFVEKILPLCDDHIVVTDASPSTISHTRMLLEDMAGLGIDPARITVVLNNRARFEAELPWAELQTNLRHPIAMALIPAPEMLAAAARRHLPAVLAMPENATAQQMLKLGDEILTRKKAA